MTQQPLLKSSWDSIARAIEYTDLRKTVTYRDVETMCLEAVHYGIGTILVPSALIARAVACCEDEGPSIASVLSYPFGTQSACVKSCEAAVAVEQGVRELDVVPHFGAILANRWDDVHRELSSIRKASDNVPLKLVLETGRLTTEQLQGACSVAVDSGFQYVVNTVAFRLVSTDPNAEGTASVGIIRSLLELASNQLRVKAAGGVSSLHQARNLLEAGAQRVAIAMSPGLLRAMHSEQGAK
ncbi:deoxyribose-phosphate aldolase [Candidatus Bipolaricaulota bacterium]|nr:deoxyribose-phosphate aldolase [Candidatus Bipolaricaulota bacterium]